LVIKNKPEDVNDLLVWKWNRWPDTPAGSFGDPMTTESYTVCVFHDLDGAPGLVYRTDVGPGGTCGTASCWRAVGPPAEPVGYKYVDKPGTSDGMVKISLKSAEGRPARIGLRGKGANLPEAELPLTMPVAVQLQTTAGECWSSEFAASGLLKNESTIFKARSQ
jgi:hypothetical protein